MCKVELKLEVAKSSIEDNMIKKTELAVLLLLTQASFAEISPLHVGDIEEGVSYPYPFFYDDTDSFSDEDESELESKADESKKSPTAQHARIGKAKITVDVENTDFLSQCQAEWERTQKKDEPKKSKSSNFRKDSDDEKDDKEKDHSPRARFLIEWSSEN